MRRPCRRFAQKRTGGRHATANWHAHHCIAPTRMSLQVDDRMNGDGTGKILGISDPALFWVIAGVFTTVWAVYYIAGRDLDSDDNVSGASSNAAAVEWHACGVEGWRRGRSGAAQRRGWAPARPGVF